MPCGCQSLAVSLGPCQGKLSQRRKSVAIVICKAPSAWRLHIKKAHLLQLCALTLLGVAFMTSATSFVRVETDKN